METDREEKYEIVRTESISLFNVAEKETGTLMNEFRLDIKEAAKLKDKLNAGEPEETDQEEKLKDEDYLLLQTQLTTMAMLASLLEPEDISKFINAINHAETIGPIVDPTAYRKSMSNLSFIKEIAEATLKFNKTVRTIQARIYGKVGKDLIDHQEGEDSSNEM